MDGDVDIRYAQHASAALDEHMHGLSLEADDAETPNSGQPAERDDSAGSRQDDCPLRLLPSQWAVVQAHHVLVESATFRL